MAEPLTLEPPPKLTKKIRMKRAYSYNKNGDLVLRPPTPTKKRPRTFSFRKPNKNFAKVSVRRGSQELSGKERRTRIYELLYFIPSAVLKALTPKQLDNLLVAHRCAICLKVFRLPQGVKSHKEDAHENRTLLSFFKKKDVNNNKENDRPKAFDELSSENVKKNDNPSVLNKKHSIKNYFKIKKSPVFVSKPLGVTPQRYGKGSETRTRKSPENDKCTPRLDNIGKGSISKEKELMNGSQDLKSKPKLMTGKRWRQKKFSVIEKKDDQAASPAAPVLDIVKKDQEASPATPLLDVEKKANQAASPATPVLDIEKKDDQAASPATPVIKTVTPTTPVTKTRPKLMTPKNWRKRLSTLTPKVEGDKVSPSSEVHELTKELSLTTDLTSEIPEHVRKVPSPTILSTPLSLKPKLMTKKKWKKKLLAETSDKSCEPATEKIVLSTDSNVEDQDLENTLPVLLHKEIKSTKE